MIEVRGVTKQFTETKALDDLTFSAKPGRVTGFLGPNGAGKTTTLRVILGLVAPTHGTATIGGRHFTDLPSPMREVGALLDAHALHGGRRVQDHLRCLATSNAIPPHRVNEVLDLVGLGDVADRRIRTFSLGMYQRLGIAAALLGDPATIIFDEPNNGLDPEGILWVRTLIRCLADEGRAVLVSSHQMNEMALTADRLVIIGKGRLLEDTSTEALLASRPVSSVLVRSAQTAHLASLLTEAGASVQAAPDRSLRVTGMDCATIGQIAAGHSVALSELAPRRATLEDVFMQLTRNSVQFGGTQGAAR
ncbi:ATP-binding cassette domain-containing protein [Schaalia naturae]|jgi:ABC-2 type transport system ATP-binding protein|uniref:ATP-binding cassette domain-containing protein n=1 Tax=Schaalia naturae TaxID=635203 RepID=A0ABW2SKV2_9ACTO